MEQQFIELCEKGDLEGCQRYIRLNPNINISAHNDYAFRYACENGHLNVAQWLLQIKSTIDISVYNEFAFRYACKNGHLAVAKWLLQVKPDIDISASNGKAFSEACIKGYLEVAEWIEWMNPLLYKIHYDEHNNYKSYTIRFDRKVTNNKEQKQKIEINKMTTSKSIKQISTKDENMSQKFLKNQILTTKPSDLSKSQPQPHNFGQLPEVPVRDVKTISVTRITIKGINYLISSENVLYNSETKEPIGIWDPETKTVKLLPTMQSDDDDNDDDDDDDDDDEEGKYMIYPEKPTIPIDNINLCFVGGVSTGKSTILNAIFCEELTQCKIKRTTMVPTVYIENDSSSNNITSPEVILTTISDKNKEIIEKTETGKKINKKEYDELAFNVGKLDINILEGSYVNVYDIPGLNDARTKDVYYDYLDTNFTKFNLIVLIVDIHSGLNTSDEIDIVNFITTHTKYELDTNNKKIYTLVIVNKADDMILDGEDADDILKLTGELSEMFEQVEKTILLEFNKHNILEHLVGIMPLCAIDSYLYRMVKTHGKKFKLSQEQILKIGINENGKKFSTLKPATQEKKVYEILNDENFINTMIKLSGFSRLESILHKFLGENNIGKQIRVNNLLFELGKFKPLYEVILESKNKLGEIKTYIKRYTGILDTINKIDKDIYISSVETLLGQLNKALSKIILTTSEKNEAIDYYDKINEQIIHPYFGNFVIDEYPEYVTSHITSLIYSELKDKPIDIEVITQTFDSLNKIDMLTKKEIETIFNIIVTNILGKRTICFKKETSITTQIKDLINIFKICEELDANISPFLRFVLINYYDNICFDADSLYRRCMFYKKFREIPMYHYIISLISNSGLGSGLGLEMFIFGLSETDINTQEFMLENYYISYEKLHNSINLV